ncbi:MAG: type B DNA-directed DNA polymerase [Thermoplasmatales archaeon]
MIVDAWGGSTIYVVDEKRHVKKWEYKHVVYVAGEQLERITDDIDGLPWLKWDIKEMEDIFSRKKVLSITLPPEKISLLIDGIERIGNHTFKIYNADINIIQSFMVTNNLHFFGRGDDVDFSLPDLTILNISFIDGIREIEINGKLFSNLSASIDYFFSMLEDSNIVISEGGDMYFPEFFRVAKKYGYYVKSSISKERTFTSYGRISHRRSGFMIHGIPHVDKATSFLFSEGGLEGLATISKLTSLPIFHTARITPGTAVSSYEVREALEKGIMIPLYKDDHESIKTIDSFIEADRGGLYLQPIPGIYENVTELDFSSMYPSIIVTYNLSPETINEKCKNHYRIENLGYNICMDKIGKLPEFLSDLLNLRLYFKKMKEQDEIYRRKDAVLKWLLLTSFGYTGYKNAKFGRIEVHEAITSIGRSILTNSIRIAEDEGFNVIHGIVDSLWLQGNGNIESVIKKIERESRLKISLEGRYKWIVFLPTKDGMGSLNKYFGLKDDGKFKVRGIEMRRSDFPNICKKMQLDILNVYSKVEHVNDFKKYYADVERIYNNYKDRIINGDIDDSDLMIDVVATRWPEYYKVNSIRKSAIERAKTTAPGDKISFFVISEKKGRVDLENLENRYDKEFYARKLHMAWDSISYPFYSLPIIYQKTMAEYDTN